MGNVGREFLIKKSDVVLCAGIQNKSVTINNTPVDISSDDDDGWRKLLSVTGLKTIDISFSGVAKSDELKELAMDGTSVMLEDITIEYADGSTLEGDFFFASLGESGGSNEAITFDASLNSSGEITFAPASA
jgi:predicted secreted protein